MRSRVVLIVFLCGSIAFAQFQAQHGWGLPHRVASSNLSQGLALDLSNQRVILAEQTGIVAHDLRTNKTQTLLTAQGVKRLSGTSGGQTLGLVWYQRNLSENSAVWAWFQGKAQKLAETEYAELAIGTLHGQPLVVYATSEGEETVIYAHPWAGKRVVVHRSKLNIGALAAAVTSSGQIGVLFAEGYRNPQDEKYDAIFTTGTLQTGFRSRRLGAAVYTGREQRYAVAVRAQSFLPAWWFESDDEQRNAALTKAHNPRLAYEDAGQIHEFAGPGTLLGQSQTQLYYSIGNTIWALNPLNNTVSQQLIAPESIVNTALAETPSQRTIAWQSFQADGFASTVYLSDSSQPYQPKLLDRLSVLMGWNPWYPAQNALAQTLLSLLIAAGAVMLTAPIIWYASHRWQFGLLAATLCGTVFVLLSRFVSGQVQAPGWSLEGLLTAPWWAAALGLALGGLTVWLARYKLQKSELAPVIASSLMVLLGVFTMMFSRAGFIHF